MPSWLIFVLVLLVLIVSFGAYMRAAHDRLLASSAAQAMADKQAAEARVEADAMREESRVAAARVARWDKFVTEVVGERDRWAAKCETLHRKNAYAQDLLWREIDQLSRLLSRAPRDEVRAAFQRLKEEQRAVIEAKPKGEPERPDGPLQDAKRPC